MRTISLQNQLLAGAAMVAIAVCASPAAAQTRNFNVAAGPAAISIPMLARQAGVQILARGQTLESKRTNAVHGQYTVDDALSISLRGTGLRANPPSNGIIVISAETARQAPESDGRTDVSVARTEPVETASTSPIVVTGSRVSRSTFNTPTPVTVIDSGLMESLGQNNAAEALKIVPQNANFQSTANIGFAAAQQQGNVGVETANLRGLNPSNGGVRTLVLVDTRRFVPTTAGGGIDLNQIPSMLIERTEVVTGGASAQYGTDAVAGVVNIILDKDLEGIKAQLDYGQTFYNDGRNWHGSLAYGSSFADGRGHFIIGGEYSKDWGIGDCVYERAWCAEAWGVALNELNRGATTNLHGGPAVPPNGLPRNLILPNVKFSMYSLQGMLRGGTVGTNAIIIDPGTLTPPVNGGSGVATAFGYSRSNPSAMWYQNFNADGTALSPYDSGQFPSAFGNAVGGSGIPEGLRGNESPIRIPSERANILARAQFEFSPDLTGYFEGAFSRRFNRYKTSSQGPQSQFILNTNNAYLQCSNYDDLTNAQRATLALRQQNCTPVTTFAPAGTPIAVNGRIGVYAPGTLDANNRLVAGRQVPVTDLPTRLWNALRADANLAERYLAPGATTPYTSQADFLAPTIGGIAWHKHVRNVARPENTSKSETYRFVGGLEGSLFENFDWDVYYQYGHSQQQERLNNTRVGIFFKTAIDAVFAPDGSIQCNHLVDPNHPNNPNNPNNINAPGLASELASCVPLNLIGLTELNGRLDPAALAYAYRTQDNDVEFEQHIAAFNIRGDLFEGWAGPIGVATGVETRLEKGAVVHGDPTPAWYDQFSRPQLGFPYSGELKIFETYGELNVPLLRDFVLADYLEVGGAYRRTWQNNKDTTPGFEDDKNIDFATWKANVDWQVTDFLRLRATRSRDARAAGFRDLTFKGTPSIYGASEGRINNPWFAECQAANQVPNCAQDESRTTLSGNFTLLPEKADTWTVGGVFTPGGIARGFRLSVDWYDITIARAISSAGSGINAQGIVDQCFQFGNYCEFIQEDVGGNDSGPFVPVVPGQPIPDVGFVRPVSQNIGNFFQRGLDIELAYNLDLDRISSGLDGSINIRSVWTHVYDFIVDPNASLVGDEVDYAGQSGAIGGGGPAAFSDFQPSSRWRSSHWITYKNDGFQTTLGARYIGPGVYNTVWQGPDDPGYDPQSNTSVNDNTVDSSVIFSLAFSYEFYPLGEDSGTSEFFLAIDNLLGSDPPVAPSGVDYPTNPTYFDTLGARWRAGLRFEF